jgi:hypothetical protein
MTDDFQLFQDQDDGDPVDADVALITAYLARELSLVQVVAVEERLAGDRAFREKVAPIIEAWATPTLLGAAVGRDAAEGRALTREEIESGWQRYVGERAELDAHDGPRLIVDVEQPKRKRISMTRIAAGIAAITLPIIGLAQAVVYASKHPATPGHSVAKEIVAPFVEAPPAPPPKQPERPLPAPVDVRVGRELEKTSPAVQRAARAEVPVAETPAPARALPLTTPKPVAVPNPDRARIAAYVSKHMPEVIRGDTNAAYIVMVLDTGANYRWGTYGTGILQIRIAGDTRTPGERVAQNAQFSVEYTGMSRAGGGGGGGMGGAVRRSDSGYAIAATRGGGGGGFGPVRDSGTALRADSMLIRRLDSAQRLVAARRDTVAASGALVARAAGGGGGVGGSAGQGFGTATLIGGSSLSRADSGRAYVISYGRPMPGQTNDFNTASGLQEPSDTESGIQGLKSASLTKGETYIFSPGQLTKQALRVVVVYLSPSSDWKGR